MIQSLTIFVCLKAPIEQKMRREEKPTRTNRREEKLLIYRLFTRTDANRFFRFDIQHAGSGRSWCYNRGEGGPFQSPLRSPSLQRKVRIGKPPVPVPATLSFPSERGCAWGAPRTLIGVIGPARVGEVLEGRKVGNTYLIRGLDLRKVGEVLEGRSVTISIGPYFI